MRKKSMFLYAVIVILMVYLSCDVTRAGENAAYKTAIERVLEKDKDLFKILSATPSDRESEVKGMTAYTQGLRKIDMSKCPIDFRVAYTNHIHAWEAFTREIAEIQPGTLAMIVYSLAGGYAKLKSLYGFVETTWKEVEIEAVKYGVSLDVFRIVKDFTDKDGK